MTDPIQPSHTWEERPMDMDHRSINHADRLRFLAKLVGRAALPHRWSRELEEAAVEIETLTAMLVAAGLLRMTEGPIYSGDSAVEAVYGNE